MVVGPSLWKESVSSFTASVSKTHPLITEVSTPLTADLRSLAVLSRQSLPRCQRQDLGKRVCSFPTRLERKPIFRVRIFSIPADLQGTLDSRIRMVAVSCKSWQHFGFDMTRPVTTYSPNFKRLSFFNFCLPRSWSCVLHPMWELQRLEKYGLQGWQVILSFVLAINLDTGP